MNLEMGASGSPRGSLTPTQEVILAIQLPDGAQDSNQLLGKISGHVLAFNQSISSDQNTGEKIELVFYNERAQLVSFRVPNREQANEIMISLNQAFAGQSLKLVIEDHQRKSLPSCQAAFAAGQLSRPQQRRRPS